MKKIILPFFLLFAAWNSQAQCVPGTLTAPKSGYIIPDSATNLNYACPGTNYTQIMYIKASKDTTITITNPITATLTADIDSFVISKAIVGLPAYINTQSVPAPLAASPGNVKTNYERMVIKGDSLACVLFSGSVPSATPAGNNPLGIEVRVYLSNIHSTDALVDLGIPGFFPGRKTDTLTTITDYSILVKPTPCFPASVSKVDATQFNLIGNVPNPFDSRTQIVFESKKVENYQLRIVNMIGEVVFEKSIKSSIGLNYIPVDASQWAKGVYPYSLSNGVEVVSNKLQLK